MSIMLKVQVSVYDNVAAKKLNDQVGKLQRICYVVTVLVLGRLGVSCCWF